MQYYDQEEKELIESIQKSYDEGTWEVMPLSDKKQKNLQKMAKETIKHRKVSKKSLSIRLYNETIEKLKFQAAEEGMPYQTLISSILHQFTTGKLKRVGNTFV